MTMSRLVTSALYERYIPSGIAGYGGWASITAATGTYTTGTYNDGAVDWIYYKWTGNGSVTLTAGVVDALIVGGGGAYDSYPGDGGEYIVGVQKVTSGTHSITVGAGGTYTGGNDTMNGQVSSLGSYSTGKGVGNSPGAIYDTTIQSSSITGSTTLYSGAGSQGEPSRGPGCGGSTTNRTGAAGVVIIRVPVNPDLWGSPAMPPNAQITNFTASGTFSVPLTCQEVEICVVGGGGGGGYTNGGGGSSPVVSTQTVTPGESLTVTIGAGGGALANGTASTVVGSFGTVTGTGGTHSSVSSNNVHGTVTDFGFFGGGGSPNGNYFPGRPGGGNGNFGSGGYAGHPNTGGGGGGSGGGPGAGSGGSGYVAILAK